MFRSLVFSIILLFIFSYNIFAQSVLGANQDKEKTIFCGLDHVRETNNITTNQLRSFPSYGDDKKEGLIYNNDNHISVFRLAVCISQSSYINYFRRDKQNVLQFWEHLEKKLNENYTKECGIKFDIIKDTEKLIIQEYNPDIYDVTRIINNSIGEANYDVGISINNRAKFQGLATLGGIRNPDTKAHAYADESSETVAHELGHLFGTRHTHSGYSYDGYNYDGLFLEPGNGQSIMSYGSPRGFFALASIIDIKNTVKDLGYYTDSSRTNAVGGISGSTHRPYIIPATKEKPLLNRQSIQNEYIVSKGTKYQFYIPTTKKNEDWKFAAHPYDISRSTKYDNLLQPTYRATTSNNVMYHKRYDFPVANEETENRVLRYSNSYEKGEYKYILSAFNSDGYHDSQLVKLKIVDGSIFRITKFSGPSNTTYTAKAGSSKLKIDWNPCHDLYRADSKVRILLSKDFGETYPYVLADNEDNDGSWEGVCPYIEIGKVKREFVRDNVRAAVIKVEVKGEAAYDITHTSPYLIRGGDIIGTGGFMIKVDRDNEIIFENAPDIYMTYNSINDVPAIQNLTAKYKGQSSNVSGVQVQQGNSYKRTWTATIGTKKAVFTQIITWNEGQSDEVAHKIKNLHFKSYEIYKNLGQLGYPSRKSELTKAFIEAYNFVFDENGVAKDGVNLDKCNKLEKALDDLTKLPDNELVMPISGAKYKIANYRNIFGKEYLYGLVFNGGNMERITNNMDEASVWTCEKVGDIYRFTIEDKPLNMNAVAKTYEGVSLLRGYTWGTYSIVGGFHNPSETSIRIASVPINLGIIYISDINKVDLNSNRSNKLESPSTDFKLILVGDAPNNEEEKPTIKYYKVTINQTTGGTVTVKGENNLDRIQEGTTIEFDLLADVGYKIKSLKSDGVDILASKTLRVSGNHTITVEWEKLPTIKYYAVTINQTTGGTVTVKGENNLDRIQEGTTIEFDLLADVGYKIKSLKSDGVDILASKTLRVSGNHTITVEWEKEEVNPNSIDDIEYDNNYTKIYIYPNPVIKRAILRGVAIGTRYQLYNVYGKIYKEDIVKTENEELNLENLPSGIYILKAQRVLIKILKY